MDADLHKRVVEVIESLGKAQCADLLGCTRGKISHFLKGRQGLGVEAVLKIVSKSEFRERWLLHGELPKRKLEVPANAPQDWPESPVYKSPPGPGKDPRKVAESPVQYKGGLDAKTRAEIKEAVHEALADGLAQIVAALKKKEG